MERLNSGDSKIVFGTNLRTLSIGLMKRGRAKWQEAEATSKDFNIVLTRQDKNFTVIQDAIPLILHCKTMCYEYMYHTGCAVNLHSITNSGFIAGGQNSSRDRQTVFFAAVNPTHMNHKDPQELDLTKPRLASFKQKWKMHQAVYSVDVQLAQRKGLKFCQTRSNAIIIYDTLPAYCVPKVVVMETGEIIYEKVCASPRPPPNVSFKDKWMKELDSDIAGSSKDSQRIQPKSKT